MDYHFKVHKEDKGYWAECIELKGCSTQGDTMAELEENMAEALNLFLSEPDNSLVEFPRPKNVQGKNIVAVAVNPSVFLAMSIRQERMKRKFTQKQMMSSLNIKTLSNYQRLENPKKANPEFKTLIAIKKILPGLDLTPILESKKRSRAG